MTSQNSFQAALRQYGAVTNGGSISLNQQVSTATIPLLPADKSFITSILDSVSFSSGGLLQVLFRLATNSVESAPINIEIDNNDPKIQKIECYSIEGNKWAIIITNYGGGLNSGVVELDGKPTRLLLSVSSRIWTGGFATTYYQ